jgi:hypothetical protein
VRPTMVLGKGVRPGGEVPDVPARYRGRHRAAAVPHAPLLHRRFRPPHHNRARRARTPTGCFLFVTSR